MQNCVGQQNISNQPMVQQPVAQQSMTSPQNVSVPNYSGVNIQIFNPSVTPPGATAPVYNVNAPNYAQNPQQQCCYPSGYYTNNWGNPKNDGNAVSSKNESSESSKKTEKREIVQLTDEYIKTIENYLNSQDKEIRLMGAKEVVARLEEDHSRRDDKALNALVNKMLQDPSKEVRFLALAAVNSRAASGDDITVNLLKQLENSKSGYGQEALEASNALLKMSGQTTEKEFEVTSKKSNEKKSEKKEQKYYVG